jgi:hypothetical protein
MLPERISAGCMSLEPKTLAFAPELTVTRPPASGILKISFAHIFSFIHPSAQIHTKRLLPAS